MSSNERLLREKYTDPEREEARSKTSRAEVLEFHYTKKILGEYINLDSTVAEIGCATGYYAMAFHDNCKEYTGVDLSPTHIEFLNGKIKENGIANVKTYVGDATRLDFLADKTFDVVLVLGPMYHLTHEDRELAFKESVRICKDGGITAYAYFPPTGVYARACVAENGLIGAYPNKFANECLFQKGFSDTSPDMFFFTMPEAIASDAERHGLRIIKNAGVNFMFNAATVNNMTDEQYEAWLEIADFMCESPSCTGLSEHSLLVCEKV